MTESALAEETAERVNRIALLRLAASLVRRVSHSLRIDAERLERLLHDGLNLRVERAHCLIAKQDLRALPPLACTSMEVSKSYTDAHQHSQTKQHRILWLWCPWAFDLPKLLA